MTEKPPGGDSLKARLQRGFADVDQKRRRLGGGLVPPPELSLQRRIEALEARVAELERLAGEAAERAFLRGRQDARAANSATVQEG